MSVNFRSSCSKAPCCCSKTWTSASNKERACWKSAVTCPVEGCGYLWGRGRVGACMEANRRSQCGKRGGRAWGVAASADRTRGLGILNNQEREISKGYYKKDMEENTDSKRILIKKKKGARIVVMNR
eukprot:gb/GECH01012352.1/.p1 GENE.gb/GECH01012352.1/~~gb/GECH01012352.1/.p1  ORF type:complete len:127 (+),score=3.84 gb/GECH01012352.1/:1-381(+)